MAEIKLEKINLDYILKTGSISIKKSAIDFTKGLLQKPKQPRQIGHSSFRALKDISLSIRKGDRVGLLGRNGAGKSTLLRVLAKVYKPSTGHLHIQGDIASLFDVNLGLNPEASGKENIVLLGILRGLSWRKAKNLIPEVAEFTELGDFLLNPVRTYSTGMQMKLAFAVATAGQPEILLIDEIIGAGDIHFMDKAEARIQSLIANSQILVLTSHSTKIIKSFCNKVLVLDKGQIQFQGDVNKGIEFYKKNYS